jgi:hypothetical protein
MDFAPDRDFAAGLEPAAGLVRPGAFAARRAFARAPACFAVLRFALAMKFPLIVDVIRDARNLRQPCDTSSVQPASGGL